MSKPRPTEAELIDLLNAPSFRRDDADRPPPSTDPISPTPMIVTVDRIEPYDRNPRRSENSEYERIKESIRADGMDQTLTITRRPGADRYMIAAGGNTRLLIVQELWRETGDPRFEQIHCLFQPWSGDVRTLIAHLKENDLRGDLAFIDRALAVRDLRRLIEEENGAQVSLRELQRALKERGYSVSHVLLSWFDYAVDVLHPSIPETLERGFGNHQIKRIRALDKAFAVAWQALGLEAEASVFTDVLARNDGEAFDLEQLRLDLEAELSVTADCDLQRVRLVLGSALNGSSADELRDALAERPGPEPASPPRRGAGAPPSSETPEAPGADPREPGPSAAEPPPGQLPPASAAAGTNAAPAPAAAPQRSGLPARPPGTAAGRDDPFDTSRLAIEEYPLLHPPGHGDALLGDDLAALRVRACAAAEGIAACMKMGLDIVIAIDAGYGYLVSPIPVERQIGRKHLTHMPTTAALWWLLAGVSDQFGEHGKALAHAPPEWTRRYVGNAMGEGCNLARWLIDHSTIADAMNEVPMMAPAWIGQFALNESGPKVWPFIVELVSTARRIWELTGYDPWGE